MNLSFFHRPEIRKYNYKPQYESTEKDKSGNSKNFDKDDFGEKLRNSWDSKRKIRKNLNSTRNVIWIAFILFLLLILAWKFVFKN